MRAAVVASACCVFAAAASQPNIVVLFCDDFGWGDVGVNNPDSETPQIDMLAATGMRFTDMHAGASVCTPSRAALLTGRLAPRTGVFQNFWTDAEHGLSWGEETVARYLRQGAGYDTAMIGKWHLGTHVYADGTAYHPTYRGFDQYEGIPYSVDMGCTDVIGANLPPDQPCPAGNRTDGTSPALPMYNATMNCGNSTDCNSFIFAQPVNLTDVSSTYGAYANNYIMKHAAPGSNPFFLYVAFAHTHVPLAHADKWTNASRAKTVFADTVLELDDTIGGIVRALEAAGLRNDTLIIATADNGPWQVKCDLTGNPGPYVGAYQKVLGGGGTMKMTTWEGGHRVFGIASWPGRIPANVTSNALVSTLDILPTSLAVAGVPLPTDRQFDGVDLSPVLFNDSCVGGGRAADVVASGRACVSAAAGGHTFLYHPDGTGNLTAMRYNNFKIFFRTDSQPACKEPAGPTVNHNPPLVFDLDADPGESTPVMLPNATMAMILSTYAELHYNISSTMRFVANYSEGGKPYWPCCNPMDALCRCTPPVATLITDA